MEQIVTGKKLELRQGPSGLELLLDGQPARDLFVTELSIRVNALDLLPVVHLQVLPGQVGVTLEKFGLVVEEKETAPQPVPNTVGLGREYGIGQPCPKYVAVGEGPPALSVDAPYSQVTEEPPPYRVEEGSP